MGLHAKPVPMPFLARCESEYRPFWGHGVEMEKLRHVEAVHDGNRTVSHEIRNLVDGFKKSQVSIADFCFSDDSQR